jgi:uncharacterized membrane protein
MSVVFGMLGIVIIMTVMVLDTIFTHADTHADSGVGNRSWVWPFTVRVIAYLFAIVTLCFLILFGSTEVVGVQA